MSKRIRIFDNYKINKKAMGVEIITESEVDNKETLRKHNNLNSMSDDNTTEKELLQMIANNTNRTSKNLAFWFWLMMIMTVISILTNIRW